MEPFEPPDMSILYPAKVPYTDKGGWILEATEGRGVGEGGTRKGVEGEKAAQFLDVDGAWSQNLPGSSNRAQLFINNSFGTSK